jgi:hypothetical protein
MKQAGRHEPDDEYIDDGQCAEVVAHKDHYWRKDGKRFRFLDDPTVRYCHGMVAAQIGETP